LPIDVGQAVAAVDDEAAVPGDRQLAARQPPGTADFAIAAVMTGSKLSRPDSARPVIGMAEPVGVATEPALGVAAWAAVRRASTSVDPSSGVRAAEASNVRRVVMGKLPSSGQASGLGGTSGLPSYVASLLVSMPPCIGAIPR
jgi:hypothetical protein